MTPSLMPGMTANHACVRPAGGIRARRGGFILMEVIVAMTLLALIMTPLAAMVFKITARSHRSIGNTYRNAIVMEQVNLLESLPYDSLASGTTTTTVTDKPYPYTKTVIIAQYFQKWQLRAKSITLIINPANPLYRPDTTKFMRSSASTNRSLVDDGQ
jgi:hypothetical protein